MYSAFFFPLFHFSRQNFFFIALVVLKKSLCRRSGPQAQKFTCLCLTSAGIKACDSTAQGILNTKYCCLVFAISPETLSIRIKC